MFTHIGERTFFFFFWQRNATTFRLAQHSGRHNAIQRPEKKIIKPSNAKIMFFFLLKQLLHQNKEDYTKTNVLGTSHRNQRRKSYRPVEAQFKQSWNFLNTPRIVVLAFDRYSLKKKEMIYLLHEKVPLGRK